MEPKIVLEPTPPIPAGRRRMRPTVVIADRGDAAWLVILDPSVRPEVGARFHHHGLLWEITTARSLERTYVAEPVSH